MCGVKLKDKALTLKSTSLPLWRKGLSHAIKNLKQNSKANYKASENN